MLETVADLSRGMREERARPIGPETARALVYLSPLYRKSALVIKEKDANDALLDFMLYPPKRPITAAEWEGIEKGVKLRKPPTL